MHFTASISLLGSALLLACGGAAEDSTVTLVKSVDSIQCVTVPETIDQLDAALAGANIAPIAKSCGWDGNDRLSTCGAIASYLRIIEVPASQAGAASTLGYKSLDSFGKVVPVQCPQ